MKSGIYSITNVLNSKVYIGSSANIWARWNQHRSHLNRNSHHSIKLQNAWNKYGASSFNFSVVELVKGVELLTIREQYWLDLTHSAGVAGYNVAPTAYSLSGFRHSAESKEKCRVAKMGIPMLPHVKALLLLSNLGKKRSQATRSRMAAAMTGKKHSLETKAKMSIANKGRVISEEHRAKLSLAMKGKKLWLGRRHSEESKARISAAKCQHLTLCADGCGGRRAAVGSYCRQCRSARRKVYKNKLNQSSSTTLGVMFPVAPR